MPDLLLPCIRVFLLLVVAGFVHAADDIERCSSERPKLILEGLTAIDDDGEARLTERLEALSEHESWTQSDWESYTLELADNPRADELSGQRDALVREVFSILARPSPACAELDRLEAEIFAAERAQWEESIRRVEQRLRAGKAPGYF